MFWGICVVSPSGLPTLNSVRTHGQTFFGDGSTVVPQTLVYNSSILLIVVDSFTSGKRITFAFDLACCDYVKCSVEITELLLLQANIFQYVVTFALLQGKGEL